MEPSAKDNTGAKRMKRDFNAFLSGTSGTKPAGVSSFDKEKETKTMLKDVEMIRYKTYISQLESRVSSLETSKKIAQVNYERECESLKQDTESEKKKMSNLRQQLRQFDAKEQEARSTIAELREELLKVKQRLESRVLQLHKEKADAESRLTEENQQQRLCAAKLKQQVLKQQADLQIANSQLQEAQEQLSMALKRCADAKEQVAALEEKGLEALNAEIRIKELETELESRETETAVTTALKSKLLRFKELEQENARLREKNDYYKEMQDNVALLREQTESMRRKLERSEQRVTELTELKVENEELKHQLAQWSGGSGESPSQVAGRIGELQSANALLLEKQGVLQASVHSLEASAAVARQELAVVTEQLSKEQTNSEQLTNDVKLAQSKILLMTKERDSYKSIIESYEGEPTLSLRRGGATESSDAILRQRKREDILASYRYQTNEQEKELKAHMEHICRLKERIRQLQREQHSAPQQAQALGERMAETDAKMVLQLREVIAGLERDVERLRAEKLALEDPLQGPHLQGDDDQASTKVVCQNPLTEAQAKQAAELSKLREENIELHARMKVFEANGAGNADVMLQVQQKLASEPVANEVMQGMKEKLDKAETKNKRLMEEFKRTSQEVRELCYQLLGYRLDIPCQNQYKLMSQYAKSPEDYFLFRLSGEGTIQLLGTGFLQQPAIAERIETYLTKHSNSIPAFLSAVTIDLFNSRTK